MSTLDPVTRRVASILYAGARRAYGYTPDDERPDLENICRECGGDGCLHCDFTGDAT